MTKAKLKKTCWIKSVNKAIKIILIEENLNKSEVFDKEKIYIKLFKSLGSKLKNSTEGGENPPSAFGIKRSKETCRKISEANIGQIRISIRGINNHKSKSIIQIDKSTKLEIYAFSSVLEAERLTNITSSSILKFLKNIRKYGGGYDWKYIERKEYDSFDFNNKIPGKLIKYKNK